MSWWETIQNWGSALLNNKSVTHAATEISSFTYGTILKTVELAPPTIKTLVAPLVHPPTRQVAYHILRILAEDVFPLITINYVFDNVKKYSQEHLLEEDANLVSVDTILQASILLLQTAIWTYNLRKKTQATVRMAVVTLEAAQSLNTVNPDLPKQICLNEKCDSLRFIKGSFRDLTAFWATEAALSLVEYIPYGSQMAAILSVYHHGRYALTMVLPDLCQRHQVDYLNEYAELPLALGIHHFASTFFISYLIESFTKVPAYYYRSYISQAVLLTEISIAAHSRLPPPVHQSTRKVIDPIAMYQDLIGFIFDTVAAGLKKQIPLMLKKPPSNIPWKTIYNLARQVHHHAYTKNVEKIILPRMLNSPETFIADPIIQPYWHYLRERSIFALRLLEDISDSFLIKVATYNPQKAARLLSLIIGIPSSAAYQALNLMKNQQFILLLGSLRRKLETLEFKESLKNVNANPYALELRKSENKDATSSSSSDSLDEEPVKEQIKDIIKPLQRTNSHELAKKIIMKPRAPNTHGKSTRFIQKNNKFQQPNLIQNHNLGLFNSRRESTNQFELNLVHKQGEDLFNLI